MERFVPKSYWLPPTILQMLSTIIYFVCVWYTILQKHEDFNLYYAMVPISLLAHQDACTTTRRNLGYDVDMYNFTNCYDSLAKAHEDLYGTTASKEYIFFYMFMDWVYLYIGQVIGLHIYKRVVQWLTGSDLYGKTRRSAGQRKITRKRRTRRNMLKNKKMSS